MSTTFEDLGFDPEYLGPEDEQKKNIRQKLLTTARKAARQVPFMEDVVAAYYCTLDPATPAKVRGTLLAALAYFVLPLDAVPDFILGIGFGDDATVLMAAIAMVRAHVRDEHYYAARDALKDDDLQV
ncbi:MAG: YkvA family protein [Roseibium sp.]